MEYQLGNNQSANSTVKIFGDNASPLLILISIILSLWIIVSNLFVLICFVKHRNSLIKSTFTVQILTLSFSDFLVGLSTIPVYITGLISTIRYELCVFQFVIFLSAQVVDLSHIFGICLTRLFVVCHLTSRTKVAQKTGLIALYLVISWIVTLGIMTVPFGIWGKYRLELSICSLNEIFQDNYKVSTTYTVSFYIVPTLLTNAIYIGILVKIRLSTRKIMASNTPISGADIATGSRMGQETYSDEQTQANSNTSVTFVQPLNKIENGSIATNEFPGIRAISFKSKASKDATKDKTQTAEVSALQTMTANQSRSSKNIEEEGNGTSRMECDDIRRRNAGSRCQPQTSLHTSTTKSHTKALNTIGLVLIMYDICVIPLIILFTVEASMDNVVVPRNWKAFVLMLLTANSALNPFIYPWKFAVVRHTLLKLLRCRIC